MAPRRFDRREGRVIPRRSDRLEGRVIEVAEPAMKLLKEEKFDLLIANAMEEDEKSSDIVEHQFKMPNHIIDIKLQNVIEPGCSMENAPQEVLKTIVQFLDDTDRISLSLASKKMAYKVEGLGESRHADIDCSHTYSYYGSKQETHSIHLMPMPMPAPSKKMPKSGAGSKWSIKIQKPQLPSCTPCRNRRIVTKYLDQDTYKYCKMCQKLRIRDANFWHELFEYKPPKIKVEEPVLKRAGVLRGDGKEVKATRNRSRLPERVVYETLGEGKVRLATAAERSERLNTLIDEWAENKVLDTSFEMARGFCPAHIYAKDAPMIVKAKFVDE